MTGTLPMKKRYLTIVTMAGAIIIIAVMTICYWTLQQDDAYFTYSYAKNLADGNGYVFNAGERVNATTSPLYTLLLALLYFLLRFIPSVTIPGIGHAVGAVSLLVTAFFLTRAFGTRSDSLYPYVVALAYLASPLLPNAVGMETYLAMMLAVMSLSFYARGRLMASALACSFAVLARPDMLLLAIAIAMYHLIVHRRLPAFSTILTFVLPITAWLIFSIAYFGELLPTTLSGKLAQTEAGIWGSGFVFLRGLPVIFSWYGSELYRTVLVFATVIGLAVAAARFRQWSALQQPVFHLIILFMILYIVAYGFVMNAPAYCWYYTPLALGMALLSALPLEGLYRFLSNAGTYLVRTFSVLVYLALILAGLWLPLTWSGTYFSTELVVYRDAAIWLNGHAAAGSSVGAGEIGILRYYYENGPVIDAAGLAHPEVIEHLRAGDFNWYVHRYQPDYLMLNHLPRNEYDPMINEDWFERDYLLRTNIRTGRHEVGIYQRRLPGE